jgi:hypothetical protein
MPVAIIDFNNRKALKRRVHVMEVQREPCMLRMGSESEMEDGLRAE